MLGKFDGILDGRQLTDPDLTQIGLTISRRFGGEGDDSPDAAAVGGRLAPSPPTYRRVRGVSGSRSFLSELRVRTGASCKRICSPMGTFILSEENDAYVGCVGLRHFSDGIGEVKRLYVISAARGCGVGGLLTDGIVVAAKQLGYTRLLLDTLPSMKAAQSMYISLGFKPTAPYRFNPVPGAAFLELVLQCRHSRLTSACT